MYVRYLEKIPESPKKTYVNMKYVSWKNFMAISLVKFSIKGDFFLCESKEVDARRPSMVVRYPIIKNLISLCKAFQL